MSEQTEEIKSSELAVVISQSGLEKDTAQTLLDRFAPLFEQASEWKRKAEALVVTDASQKREMQEARVARLALKDIRISADKTRKDLKEDSIRYGKAVQGVYNVIEYVIAPIEKHLEQQEKFAELQEAKAKSELKELRLDKLKPYGIDHSFVDVANMPQDSFDAYLAGAKKTHDDRIEAEQKAEQDRIAKEKAELDAREAQRLENEKLKKEAEERERAQAEERKLAKEKQDAQDKILADERAKADAERKEAEKKLLEERQRAESEAKRQKEDQEKKLAQERAEREKLENELKAKADAEKKKQAEVDAQKEAELSMGDSAKFDAFISDIEALKIKYQFKSKKHTDLYASGVDLLNKTIAYLNSKK